MLGPAPHRASPRFGRAPASPGMPVAAEQSRRDRSASRSSRGARRRVRAGAGREPRQRRRSTVAFKRRGLPGLGLPLSLPDSLRRPLPSLAVTIPPAWRSPSACPAAVSAGTARPHLSPVAGPLRPADRQRAGRALQDPTPSDSADPALPPSLGALGTPARRRGAARRSRVRVCAVLVSPTPGLPRFSHFCATMFVPCGESVPDLAGYTFLMVSPRFLELRVLGLECFLSGGARGAPTASGGVSPALGQRAVLASVSGVQPYPKTGCRWMRRF